MIKTISSRTHHLFLPALFILMWSSGYVVGKMGLDYAGPYTLIFIRFSSAAVIMLLVSLLTRAPWPKSWKQFLHLVVVGLLVQGIQFASLYAGMNCGVTAGVSALIVGITPIFTALIACRLFNEKVNFRRWVGAFLGVFGVSLVVLHNHEMGHANLWGYFFIVIALVAITIGTLYQKRFCGGLDLRTGGFIQLTTASLFVLFLAWHFEGFHAQLGWPLLGVSAWLSLVNSIGAVTVWFVLMKRGEASKVSSLFHLIPGVTAIMGYFVLGETLAPIALIGFGLTGLAVYLSH